MIECCADAIVSYKSLTGYKLVLVRRLNDPKGLALPGGRLDQGESLEQCVVREGKEETGLDFTIVKQLKTYSDPSRDPRGQKVSTVFLCTAAGDFHEGESGKTEVVFMDLNLVPIIRHKDDFAFDHYQIIRDNWSEIQWLIRDNIQGKPLNEFL